jgi:DNA recombination protein Rad52
MMGFEQQQVRKLRAKLKARHVKVRDVDGITLHYLEGWHVIAEANRIFGFDGWSRETVETRCVWSRNAVARFSAAYVTRVRVSVRAGETVVVREGSGAGEAHESSAGLAHERAAKAAETDATKRALMTFGNAFGLSLYGGAPQPRDTARPQPPGASSEDTRKAPEPARSSQQAAPRASAEAASQGSTGATAAPQSSAPASPVPPWPFCDPLEEAARRARGRIDKSALAVSEPRRLRDPQHLRRVAARPCIICGRNRSQAHHLKYLQPNAMARKVSDEYTVPLCSTHHQQLHGAGDERQWWRGQGVDPEPVARGLWQESLRAISRQKSGLADRPAAAVQQPADE